MEITINYYGQAVSVSMEVCEYLTQADHKVENLAHEQRRHWDGREFDEYIINTEGRFPRERGQAGAVRERSRSDSSILRHTAYSEKALAASA